MGITKAKDDDRTVDYKEKRKTIRKYEFYDMIRITYEQGHNIGNGDEFTMDIAYSKDGDYIGEQDTAKYLVEKGVERFEKRKDTSNVCSIGYIPKNKSWAGWSHRAIATFKVGDKCVKGDCGFTKQRGEWTAKNMDDVKQMAWDFADGVS